jgi:hypothetical protein
MPRVFLPIALLVAVSPTILTAAEPGLPVSLKYKFAPGDVYRTKVVHLVAVETTIQGVTETAKTRSISTKAWKVSSVDAQGNITFTYAIEKVSMWHQVADRPEVRYDSTQTQTPPPEYQHVAESIGVPMATVVISPAGAILDRKNAHPQFNPGIGELTLPLPDQPIRVGQQWSTEGDLALRTRPDAPIKQVKYRQLHTLEKVEAGVATISVQTQVLTPVQDPALEALLVQRVKKGEAKFDVDAGRLISQQVDTDKTVIGFSGNDSMMKYLSRLTEEHVREENVARKP